MHNSPKRRGELGEIAFLHRATILGLRVSKPFGDSDPYDFIVDNGRHLSRVQVKATATRHSKSSYNIKAGRRPYRGRCKKAVFSPYVASEIDFLALYLVREELWFIIPIRALKGRTSLCYSFRYPKRGPCAPYVDAWELLQADATKAGHGAPLKMKERRCGR
jgi:hypothetical protein